VIVQKLYVAGLILVATVATLGHSSAHAWDDALCIVADPPVTPPPVAPPIEPASLPMCFAAHPAAPVVEQRIDPETARQALERARLLASEGRPAEAVVQLSVVEQAFPRIADRIALLRGELLLDADSPIEACAALEEALGSPTSSVGARARVGRVRCRIAADARTAVTDLADLLRRYPYLPERHALRLDLAGLFERRGDINGAVAIYRDIDLQYPGTSYAARARGALERIAASGTTVRPVNRFQEVDRAERLVQQGPMQMAREEVDRLLREQLFGDLQRRVALAAARIARVEGRWEDARRHMQLGVGGAAATGEEADLEAERLNSDVDAAIARERGVAESRVRQLKGRSTWERLSDLRLLHVIEAAAPAGLAEPVNAALVALRSHSNSNPLVRYQAALTASGVGSDEHLVELFGSLVAHPRFSLSARYYQARALEHLGRWAEAERELIRVVEGDRGPERYYAMWAQQRLWTVREAMLCNCRPDEQTVGSRRRPARSSTTPLILASLQALVDPSVPPLRPDRAEGTQTRDEMPLVQAPGPEPEAIVRVLTPLAEAHGEAYPWFYRALDLVELGDIDAAADELHEAYLAWREAFGRPLYRAGLEAVYRGEERPRRFTDFRTRRARREMDTAGKVLFARAASAVGDEGIAVGLGGWARAQERPRAYEATVNRVARRHGLDPNLLLAVMRTESVYQRRILSYAGAIGLMQIMPRTGRLIANAVGREDYSSADLLDAETNLDFAAWYLASLIERFDGRLPLAIASYNGGPHNVRRWLRDHPDAMPLDAFLEFIPFEQTHRYVRRVLTHYAAYRAQQGLPMERLGTRLPSPEADRVGF